MEATNNVSPSVKARACRTVKTRGALSCITFEKTVRGRRVGAQYFDVPAERYADGNMTGHRLASEFLAAIKTGKPGFDPLDIIEGACKALRERDDGTAGGAIESRRGAAVGFLRPLEELLTMVARSGVHERYMDRILEHATEWRHKQAKAEADEKTNFARRMEIAKAAKAQARRAIKQISSK